MSKEVYKTIKRSISATANQVINNTPLGSGTLTRLHNAPPMANGAVKTKRWIHPPDVLINGEVEYSVKMLGHTEVSEPKGSHVVKDAIHAIRFHLELQQSVTGHSGSKLRKVDIHISLNGLKVIDSKNKLILFNHPLPKISFCADDKQDKRVFSYIASVEGGKHECFVFLSDKLAEQITLTIGEAFDLAYEQFLKNNGSGRDLESQKKIIILKKRINELESEVMRLKHQVKVSSCQGCSHQAPPTIPNTPIPPAPAQMKVSTGLGNASTSTSGLPSIAPPPSQKRGPRGDSVPNGGTLLSLNDFAYDRFDPDPEVGPRLENLQLDRLEDLYDQNFDPRANEQPKPSSSNEAASTSTSSGQRHENGMDSNGATETDLDEMLRKVNEKILEQMSLQAGMSTGDITGEDVAGEATKGLGEQSL